MSNVITTVQRPPRPRDQGMPFEAQFFDLFIVMANLLLKPTFNSEPGRLLHQFLFFIAS